MNVLKRLFVVLLITSSIYSLAQNVTREAPISGSKYPNFTVSSVSKMAVYPSCEKFTSKQNIIDCFTNKITIDLLKSIDTTSLEKGYSYDSKANFTINKYGIIENISTQGEYRLSPLVIEGLRKVNDNLIKNNTPIIPAKDENGNNVNLKFKILIKLNL